MSDSSRIAVVGGGPAGATCARLLARAGARVTLFEADPLEEKPCGGGIPARALREFPELGDRSLPRRVAAEVIVYGPSDESARLSLRGGIHLFARRELDGFLRRRAEIEGAAVVASRVRSARRGATGWELETDAGSFGGFDRLVAADGVRGAIGRHLAGPWPDDQLTLALYTYVPGVARPEVILKFIAGLNGYLWVFPRQDHVSVGICALSRSASPAFLEEELHRFIEGHYPEGRFDRRALKGFHIPASPHPPRARSDRGEGWAMVGDAAGFVDPITREGIAHAMRSAVRVAADLVEGVARTPALDPQLRWAHRHGAGFYRGPFLDGMARLAAGSPSIRRVMADLLAGDQSYRGLKRRLLWNVLPCGREVGLRTLATVLASVRA